MWSPVSRADFSFYGSRQFFEHWTLSIERVSTFSHEHRRPRIAFLNINWAKESSKNKYIVNYHDLNIFL